VRDLFSLRRDCAEKRFAYHHARQLYGEARKLQVADLTALRSELGEALMAYYTAHSALHSAMRRHGLRESRLKDALH
jgi:hypothetical protein